MHDQIHPAGLPPRSSAGNPGEKNSGEEVLRADLPWHLYHSFANLAGIPVKVCGLNGQPLAGIQPLLASGPCSVLKNGDLFSDICARNHAEAAAMAADLRRPYIYHCHMRLAGWAIPIIREEQVFPAVIIAGGVLLIEPDMALIRHMEQQAIANDVDPATLARSLRMVSVISRNRFRDAAEFLFEMSGALLSSQSAEEKAESIMPSFQPPGPVVFPPRAKKEGKRAKVQQARELTRQSLEGEVVRCLRDRKSDEAFRVLLEMLSRELAGVPPSRAGNLHAAEIFARLLRTLSGQSRIPRALRDKQVHFLNAVLSLDEMDDVPENLRRLCKKFVVIAEEATGESRPRRVKSIQSYLEKNLSKKLTLSTIGGKFGLSEKALNAVIQKYCGMSLPDYVTSIRVSEAKHLLLTTDLGIGEIARRTGFPDQSYFTKVFKSHLGVTPTEFRQKSG